MITKSLRITEKSFIYVLLLITAFNWSCSTYDNNNLSVDVSPVAVSMAMTINESGASSDASTRSTGIHEDQASQEESNQGAENERYVGTLRVLVFDAGSGTLKFNKLFSRTAADPENRFDHNAIQGTLTVDFLLLPGTYDFRVVANEETDWNLEAMTIESSTLTDYETFTSIQNITNAISNETELQERVTNDAKGIPMSGEHRFNIPDNLSGITNPVILSSIELQRTISKVEVYLTNIDPITGQIYPIATIYQIKSVSMKKINHVYHFLETTDAVSVETAQTITFPITHTRGTDFPKARILHTYMAERKNVTESAAVVVEIVVNKTGEAEDIIYTIPLYKGDVDLKDYAIYRNHFYTINCYLTGSDMPYVEIFYNDTGWNLVQKESFMGYGYNVEISGSKVSISNTVDACDPHKVTLRTISPFTFDDATVEKEFTDLSTVVSQEYTLNTVPVAGDGAYLEVYYNDILVKSFTK